MTIQPTAVYPPGTSPAAQQQRTYQTYNTRVISQPAPSPGQSVPPRRPGWATRTWNRIPSNNPIANIPTGVPSFLAARPIIFHTWGISMVIIGFDEWHNNNILPRPARLWDASLVYGLLALLSISDTLTPIANAFAIGYTFMLLWQYYNGSGTFNAGPVAGSGGGGLGNTGRAAANAANSASNALNAGINVGAGS